MVPRQPIYAGADETRENAESGSWVREPHPPRRARRGSRSRRVPSTASLRESRLTSTFARRRAHASHRRVMRAATVKAHAHEHRKPLMIGSTCVKDGTIICSTGRRRRDKIWRVSRAIACVLHPTLYVLRSKRYMSMCVCYVVCTRGPTHLRFPHLPGYTLPPPKMSGAPPLGASLARGGAHFAF